MAPVQIKTSILMLTLVLVAGCHRLRERHEDRHEHSSGDEPAIVIGDDDDDDSHHDEDHHEGKTTTTTTVHED